jgi:hypothetical protein
MKLALIIVSMLTVLVLTLFYFTAQKPAEQSVELPWQVAVHDPMHSEVFGIVLNQTTLEQARVRFGQLDGIALYRKSDGDFTLEAYFGKVSIGPFGARLIATLDASQQDLEQLVQDSVKRVPTQDGGFKWTLNEQKQAEQGSREIKSLTFIPSYRGMDQDFIRSRFGEPGRRKTVDETAELWFYPDKGIRVLVDNKGNDLFEFLAPADFKISYGAS